MSADERELWKAKAQLSGLVGETRGFISDVARAGFGALIRLAKDPDSKPAYFNTVRLTEEGEHLGFRVVAFTPPDRTLIAGPKQLELPISTVAAKTTRQSPWGWVRPREKFISVHYTVSNADTKLRPTGLSISNFGKAEYEDCPTLTQPEPIYDSTHRLLNYTSAEALTQRFAATYGGALAVTGAVAGSLNAAYALGIRLDGLQEQLDAWEQVAPGAAALVARTTLLMPTPAPI